MKWYNKKSLFILSEIIVKDLYDDYNFEIKVFEVEFYFLVIVRFFLELVVNK